MTSTLHLAKTRRDWAKEAVAETETRYDAVQLLMKRAKKNDGLYRMLTEEYLEQAARHIVHKCIRTNLEVDWNEAQTAITTTHSDNRLAQVTMSLLDTLILPNDVPLRHATQKDLIEGATFYDKQATNMHQKAAFLNGLAKKLKGRQKVGSALKESEVVTAFKKAIEK